MDKVIEPKDGWITYTEHSVGGEPMSDGPWASRTDEHWTMQPVAVYLSQTDGWNVRDIQVDPDVTDTGWVVTQVYSDGDTFGQSFGHRAFDFVAATHDDANGLADAIYQGTRDGKNSVEWRGISVWLRGVGYFNSLQSVIVSPVPVLN